MAPYEISKISTSGSRQRRSDFNAHRIRRTTKDRTVVIVPTIVGGKGRQMGRRAVRQQACGQASSCQDET